MSKNNPVNEDFLSFDDLADSRPTIPDDNYVLRVVNPIIKEKADKSGKYISYDVVVQEGPDAGYRIFNNMFSLNKAYAWSFKAALKAVEFAMPKGLTLEEAADYFVKNGNGLEFVGLVSKKPAQEKDANGNYVKSENRWENQVKRWVSRVA